MTLIHAFFVKKKTTKIQKITKNKNISDDGDRRKESGSPVLWYFTQAQNNCWISIGIRTLWHNWYLFKIKQY